MRTMPRRNSQFYKTAKSLRPSRDSGSNSRKRPTVIQLKTTTAKLLKCSLAEATKHFSRNNRARLRGPLVAFRGEELAQPPPFFLYNRSQSRLGGFTSRSPDIAGNRRQVPRRCRFHRGASVV